jgi:hypothetical protein
MNTKSNARRNAGRRPWQKHKEWKKIGEIRGVFVFPN